MRSDAPFRDAKAKLMEIKQELSKRSSRLDGDEQRKKEEKESVRRKLSQQSKNVVLLCSLVL